MILDSARISLPDGTTAQAINVGPGKELLSFRGAKPTRSLVKSQKVSVAPKFIRLVLSTGDHFSASEDQLVAVPKKQRAWNRAGRIPLGGTIMGERAGVPVRIVVIARMRCENERLVGIETHESLPFIADGVLCRGVA